MPERLPTILEAISISINRCLTLSTALTTLDNKSIERCSGFNPPQLEKPGLDAM
jgi:hypothetical protein